MHEFSDRREDGGDGFIVLGEFFVDPGFELCKSPGEFLVRAEQFPHPHESTHDLDVDGDGAVAAEDRGEHGHALLGEGVRR